MIINHTAILRRDVVAGFPVASEGMAAHITTANSVDVAATAKPAIGIVSNVVLEGSAVSTVDVILFGSGVHTTVQVAAGTYAAGSFLAPAASGGLWVATTSPSVKGFVRVLQSITTTGNGLIEVVA